MECQQHLLLDLLVVLLQRLVLRRLVVLQLLFPTLPLRTLHRLIMDHHRLLQDLLVPHRQLQMQVRSVPHRQRQMQVRLVPHLQLQVQVRLVPHLQLQVQVRLGHIHQHLIMEDHQHLIHLRSVLHLHPQLPHPSDHHHRTQDLQDHLKLQTMPRLLPHHQECRLSRLGHKDNLSHHLHKEIRDHLDNLQLLICLRLEDHLDPQLQMDLSMDHPPNQLHLVHQHLSLLCLLLRDSDHHQIDQQWDLRQPMVHLLVTLLISLLQAFHLVYKVLEANQVPLNSTPSLVDLQGPMEHSLVSMVLLWVVLLWVALRHRIMDLLQDQT